MKVKSGENITPALPTVINAHVAKRPCFPKPAGLSNIQPNPPNTTNITGKNKSLDRLFRDPKTEKILNKR